MKRFFRLRENQTSVRREVGGGLVTFMTMAYIIFVQPGVLSMAGMDFDAVMVATCLAAALATILMGVLANYPIALAPGMGENFLFVTVSALTISGIPLGWRGALAAVFLSGLVFLLLSLLKVRKRLVDAIPDSMKHAIAIGIGLFISFIGLEWAGIVIKNPAPDAMLMMGDLSQKPVLLSLFGIVVLAILFSRKVKGAILWGILLTAAGGVLFGIIRYQGVLAPPPSLAATAFQLDFSRFFTLDFLIIALLFLFMDLFDTIGTLIATASQAGFIKNGKLPRAERAFAADASGTLAGSLLGTSTVTSFIESTTGVSHGARTGLASLVTGGLFLLATFFSPLVRMIGEGIPTAQGTLLHPVTAPVLVLVGCLMFRGVKKIPWDQIDEAIPAFLVIIGMPLLYSIADGMAIGFILHPLLKLIRGKGREVSGISWALSLMFLFFLVSRIILL